MADLRKSDTAKADLTSATQQMQTPPPKGKPYELGTYARLFVDFFLKQRANDIPASVVKDPKLGEVVYKLAAVNAEMSNLRNRNATFKSRLPETVNTISDIIALLGQSATTIQHQQHYMQELDPQKREADTITGERAQLTTTIEEKMKEQERLVSETIEKLKKNVPTSTLIEAIEKQKKEVKQQAARLGVNEEIVQKKLDALQEQIVSASRQMSVNLSGLDISTTLKK